VHDAPATDSFATAGIAVVGISHRSAGFDAVERVSAGVASLPPRLGAAESLLLVTCNRVECWTAGQLAPEGVVEELARGAGLSPQELLVQVYTRTGMDAVRHAMRVAAGLDSLILGEAQILGQLARAVDQARTDGTAGPLLTRLFAAAVQAGKRARTETEICRHASSVSHAAAGLAVDAVGDASAAHALVVGTGEAAELAARALRHRGVRDLHFTGRTAANARGLAARLGATSLPWANMRDGIAAADIVVSATAAPGTVIGPDDIVARDGRALTLVDLAVPHDVDVAVERIRGVLRFDLDDLRSVVDFGRARREAAVPAIEAIIEDEAERFREWLVGRRVVPLIVELRERVIDLVQAETRQALDRLGYQDAERTADHLAQRIARKVLHEPVVRLKAHAARDGAAPHVAAIRDLFALSQTVEEGERA
jgi:glutamyl-tRNA reductase